MLLVVFATLVAAAPRYSRNVPPGPHPLHITSNSATGFAVIGDFDGTYEVQRDAILVNFKQANIRLIGTPSNQRPRVVTDIRIALARNTTGGKWEPLDYEPLAAADKVVQVGQLLALNARSIRIPISESVDLSQRWFVIEITNTLLDPANPNATKTGTCYAHSARNVFAAAR
jgi:hypothetical protein